MSNSNSSFELVSSNDSMSSGHSSPTKIFTSHIDVDAAVWLYMRQSEQYSSSVERIINDCRPSVDLEASDLQDVSDRLVLTGDDKTEVDKATEELRIIVEHCQQSVIIRQLPTQSQPVFQKVAQCVNDMETGAHIALGGPADIRVIGTEAEVEASMKQLKDMCGLAENADLPVEEKAAPEGASAAAAPGGGHTLQKMKLESDIWQYMQKNPEFADDVRRLKEEMHVDVVEAVSGDEPSQPEVQLVFSGPEDDALAAMDKATLLISRCRATTITKSFQCPDNRVFARIQKFLPTISKTPAHVSAVDGVINVTGDEEERTACCEKLVKLGLVVKEPEASDRLTLDDNTPLPDVPEVNKDDQLKAGVPEPGYPTELTEIPRPADVVDVPRAPVREIPADSEMERGSDAATAPPQDIWPYDDRPAGQTADEFPVPIEPTLWMFIEKRRREKLQELRDVFGVSIQSFQGDDGLIHLRLNAMTPDMLSCGQDAFGQLLDQLNRSIQVTAMQLGEGEQLPREVGQLFQQLAHDVDAILEIDASRILIIGSNDGTAQCQQRIAALMQQAQQMHENPAMLGEMQRRMMTSAGRGGFDAPTGPTMSRNMQNRMMMGGSDPMGPMMAGPTAAFPRMPSSAGGLMNRFGGMVDGGGASSMGVPGPVAGVPPSVLSGRPGGLLGGPGSDQFGSSADMQSGSGAYDTGMMYGGTGGMRPPAAGPKSDSESRTSAGLVTGRPGGMVGDLATTPGSVIHDMAQTGADDQPRSDGTVQPPGPSMPELPTKPPEPLPDPHMLDDHELLKALRHGRPMRKSAAACDPSPPERQPPPPREIPQQTREERKSKDVDNDPSLVEACTACEAGGHEFRASKKCPHAFCVSCVQSYFSHGETECPVCGVKDEVTGRKLTQPASGQMLTTYDNCFKLPGHETTSRGTIIVTYSFPGGIQTDDMANPGKKYSGTTKTAFLPMSKDGLEVVELLQQLFSARLLFTTKSSADSSVDQLAWDGVCHKTNVFSGPQQSGYPDPVYMRRVRSELASKGFK